MKKLLSVFFVLSCMLASTVVLAGNTRIGVVDLQKIMQNSPQMKEIQANLEKTFKARRDRLVAMEDALKKDMEEFKKDSAVLTAAKRKVLEEKIIAQQQKLEQEGQQYQQELNAANNEAMEGFYNKIKAAIAKVAKNDKYDLVFQKDAAPFSQDALDVTSKVMKEIL
jgi:outer membrane protein